MTFGRHWEWRGFGSSEHPLHDTIRELAPIFPRPQRVTDGYLWIPGCQLNVKLRESNFKLKRLLDRGDGGVEEWLEDEAENYDFPLHGDVIREVASALSIDPGDTVPDTVVDREDLLRALGWKGTTGLRLIDIEKLRWQYRHPAVPTAIVELAEIYSPERLTSVSIEDPDRDNVLRVMKVLGLPGPLRTMNYLKALEIWGQGRSIGEN